LLLLHHLEEAAVELLRLALDLAPLQRSRSALVQPTLLLPPPIVDTTHLSRPARLLLCVLG